jgi:hypothetical protein
MWADLFVNVAGAVIEYALSKLDPINAVGEWLKGEPVRLAFQKALARAYAAFARQYPRFTLQRILP